MYDFYRKKGWASVEAKEPLTGTVSISNYGQIISRRNREFDQYSHHSIAKIELLKNLIQKKGRK